MILEWSRIAYVEMNFAVFNRFVKKTCSDLPNHLVEYLKRTFKAIILLDKME